MDGSDPEATCAGPGVRHGGPRAATNHRRGAGPEGESMDGSDPEATCAEVARLVMGWRAADVPWAYDGVEPLWHTADGDPVMTVFSWRPDRNDAQNMQVLDRMIELGFELTLTARGERAAAQFSRGSGPPARGEAADRRTALLRAALAAVKSAAG